MKIFLTIIMAVLTSIGYSQNILVADNNPGAPTGAHVYSTLQEAVDAAVDGDIIHVIPSATEYDGTSAIAITTDGLSIYGIGFYPDKDGPQVATVRSFRISANNIRISGLNVSQDVHLGYDVGTYSGITVENCQVRNITSSTSLSTSISNVLVRGCLLNREAGSSNPVVLFSNRVNQSVISNSIIVGYSSTTSSVYSSLGAYNGSIIKNCIFYGDGRANKPAFTDLMNCTVTNCIFYGKFPGSSSSNFESNVFNNNVAVGSDDNTLPPAGSGSGNSGTGNFDGITDATTIFTDATITIPLPGGWVWSYLWDPEVAHASLQDGGTDGTDVGVKGSTIPYSPTGTTIPLIKKLIIPEVIKQGDNLNATIEAEGY